MLQVIGTADVTDEEVVNKWLFAREAEAMGITVDDKTMNNFLRCVDQPAASVARTSSISCGHSPGGVGGQFLSILREELLALRYRQLFHQMQDDDLWIGGRQRPTNAGRRSSG